MNVIRIADYSMDTENGSVPATLRRNGAGWILEVKKYNGEDLKIVLSNREVRQLITLFTQAVEEVDVNEE